MNGLLLPTGSKQPLRGDAPLSISPPSHLKLESRDLSSQVKAEGLSPTTPSPTSHGIGNITTYTRPTPKSPISHPNASSSSGPNLHRPSANNEAASLAFISRTSRNSAAVQKPIHMCSEFELEQRLDRNQRILSTLEGTQSPTKARLHSETEVIRDAIRSFRALRDVNQGIFSVQINEPSKEAQLESALRDLSVNEASVLGTSPPSEAFGWSRDTVAVKKQLALSSGAYLPGRKVQAMGYEQSLAIQSAALLAERERERRTEELRLKSTATARDKTSLGVPSGAAHKLGRKSISSCSGSMRKFLGPHSTSPPKSLRAGGPFARDLDRGSEHDADLETDDSDQDVTALEELPEDEVEEDPHPGPRHEDFSFGLDEEDL